jgi:site-specific recombinase XerD
VGEVVRLPGGTVTLQEAVDAYLDHQDLARSTRRVYRASLASLVAGLGPATAVGELSGPKVAGWFRGRYAAAAPATWNRELATLRAAVGWWRRRGWLAGDPTEGLERRRERVDRTRALTRRQPERLFARRDLPLRERTLWRLLYETAGRANELLALDRGGPGSGQPTGKGTQQGGRAGVGVLADRVGAAAPPPARGPDQRTGLPR